VSGCCLLRQWAVTSVMRKLGGGFRVQRRPKELAAVVSDATHRPNQLSRHTSGFGRMPLRTRFRSLRRKMQSRDGMGWGRKNPDHRTSRRRFQACRKSAHARATILNGTPGKREGGREKQVHVQHTNAPCPETPCGIAPPPIADAAAASPQELGCV